MLGIIFGYRARREIRESGGYQSGDGLALAGIIIGIVTLVLFLVVLALWISLVVTIHSDITQSSQQEQTAQCQANLRTVAIAVSAYHAEKGSFPVPPAPWSSLSYLNNYGPLTSGVDGGPYLSVAPPTVDFVVEYDSTGNVWVAPPNTFEPAFEPNQGLDAGTEACDVAVSG